MANFTVIKNDLNIDIQILKPQMKINTHKGISKIFHKLEPQTIYKIYWPLIAYLTTRRRVFYPYLNWRKQILPSTHETLTYNKLQMA